MPVTVFSVILFLLLSSTGCSFVDVRDTVSFRNQGQLITLPVLDAVQPGKTDRIWLLENLGEPSQVQQLDADSEVLTYRLEETRQQRVRVFLFFQYRKENLRSQFLQVRLNAGVVSTVKLHPVVPMGVSTALKKPDMEPPAKKEAILKESVLEESTLKGSVLKESVLKGGMVDPLSEEGG